MKFRLCYLIVEKKLIKMGMLFEYIKNFYSLLFINYWVVYEWWVIKVFYMFR